MARRKSLYIKLSRRRIKTILNLKDKQELSEEERRRPSSVKNMVCSSVWKG